VNAQAHTPSQRHVLTCPHCMKEFVDTWAMPKEYNALRFDEHRMVHLGGSFHLPPQEMRLMKVLVRAKGNFVHYEAIAAYFFAVHPNSEFVSTNQVAVHVCRLRKKLKGSGMEIVNIYSVGYALRTIPGEHKAEMRKDG